MTKDKSQHILDKGAETKPEINETNYELQTTTESEVFDFE